jgi:hypothetical protein
MTTVKSREATGNALDWLAAKAFGYEPGFSGAYS